MKVTRDTPNQLIIANTPWFIGIMLVIFNLAFVGSGIFLMSTGGEGIWFGLIFALGGGGLGFGAFCAFVRRVQIILDRRKDSILIRRQSVLAMKRLNTRCPTCPTLKSKARHPAAKTAPRRCIARSLFLRKG